MVGMLEHVAYVYIIYSLQCRKMKIIEIVYVCAWWRVCVCVCVCVHLWLCMCVYAYICLSISLSVCKCVCVCMYVCIYI